MIRDEQCKKVCRILDNALENRPTERDFLIVAVEKAFNQLKQSELVKQLEQKWIPCSERLPEDGTEVFVYLFERKIPYIAWVEDCRWYTEDFEVEKENYPIAWMELPKPFREDTQ